MRWFRGSRNPMLASNWPFGTATSMKTKGLRSLGGRATEAFELTRPTSGGTSETDPLNQEAQGRGAPESFGVRSRETRVRRS